jgi:hypothetical protein
MSDWLSTEDKAVFLAGVDDLWDMFSKTVVIFKEPNYSAVDSSAKFIPAYGPQSNKNNYELEPESQSFRALIVTRRPGQDFETNVEKVVPVSDLYLKIEQSGRDYIMDGRPNLKIDFGGKTFNIVSEEEITDFLDRKFYYFKLQLVK